MGNISDRLKELVNKHADGKHTVFAKKAGIPTSTFQYYIDGRYPKAEHLIRIYETYNININWLLTGIGEIYNGEGGYEDEDLIVSELLEEARKVLTSGDQIAFDVLERNIRYFSHAIDTERRLISIECRLANMEKKLKQSYKIRKGDPQKEKNEILKRRAM